ncbi:MAG TPA: hypothetical protein VFQ44_22310 [Streptosporangiaceae bacterium]|nr:hypothetical protein [Streptosporangiaceae bacterium]
MLDTTLRQPPLRTQPARTRPAYTDTAALNDIHALLTSNTNGTGTDQPAQLLADITTVLARSRRPMIPIRDIEAVVNETPLGRPVASIDAGNATITVRQEPDGLGLLIQITTSTSAEHNSLTVTLDNHCLHHPAPPARHTA